VRAYLLEISYPRSEQEGVEALFPQPPSCEVVLSVHRYEDDLLALLASPAPLARFARFFQLHPAVVSCHHRKRSLTRVTFQEETEETLTAFPARETDEWYHGGGRVKYLCTSSPLNESQVVWLTQTEWVCFWEDTFDLSSAAWERTSRHPLAPSASHLGLLAPSEEVSS
jgi:hypothetical protein